MRISENEERLLWRGIEEEESMERSLLIDDVEDVVVGSNNTDV